MFWIAMIVSNGGLRRMEDLSGHTKEEA
uniref:Uncharacterized protein n=1 Tax=Anopheles quadriannulatus TaxID=34691 RepID=A0A182XU20_ANOQN